MKTAIKSNNNILFRNFDVFSQSEKSIGNFKSLIFQLALKGRLDLQKLSEGRIKKPLQALVKEQKQYLKKESIPFKETPDSIWPMVELEEMLEKIKYPNKIKKSFFLKEGIFPIIDQSENFIAGYWNKKTDVFKIKNPVIIFGDHTCCFKYIDFNFVLGADGVKIIQPNKQFLPIFLYYLLLLNTKIRNLGYSRHFKALKIKEIPLPPLEIQKEIVALMERVDRLEVQTKEKSQKQNELSKSSMCFIAQAQNKKEMSHHWEILKNNFKDALYSESGAKEFKAMAFQLCLNGRLDFQKLSEGRIKKPLQALIKEQKQYLKKEGIPFEEQPDSIWPMVELGNIAKVISGQSPKSQFYNEYEQGIPFYQGKKEFGGIYLKEPVKWTTNITKIAKPNDILMSVRAPVGPVNITLQKICIGRGLASIRAIRVSGIFLFHFLQKNQDKITGGGGSVFDSINQNAIKQIKIPLPPLKVQKEIVALMKYMENIEKQIQKEKNLSVQLSQSLSHLENYQKII